MDAWLARRRVYVLAGLVLVAVLLRVVYFRQLNAGPLVGQHRWDQTDMNFFDRWASEIAGGDWLTDQALHPVHRWHQMLADAHFRTHPQEEAKLARQAAAEGDGARTVGSRRTDFAIVFTTILLVSMPGFWVGILLIWVFGVKLHWLPTFGLETFAQVGWGTVRYFVLPVIAIVLTEIAAVTRMMRASAIEVLRLEYVAHARAKGLSERRVLLRHVLPNAFGPALTVIGLILGHLLAGAAVIETVFTLPGMGRLLVESIYARDYPVVQGCLLLIALLYVLVNLIVDLLYPVFDPRVKL